VEIFRVKRGVIVGVVDDNEVLKLWIKERR
jgi:hypothetical protein